MTPQEQGKYYLEQTKYHPEDYAARDVISALLDELASIHATTGALKACHSLRGAVMEARKQAASEIIQFIVDQGTIECGKDDPYFVVADDLDNLREKFGLEI